MNSKQREALGTFLVSTSNNLQNRIESAQREVKQAQVVLDSANETIGKLRTELLQLRIVGQVLGQWETDVMSELDAMAGDVTIYREALDAIIHS
jgi:hypothetical protein